jgi:hypothetical protein
LIRNSQLVRRYLTSCLGLCAAAGHDIQGDCYHSPNASLSVHLWNRTRMQHLVHCSWLHIISFFPLPRYKNLTDASDRHIHDGIRTLIPHLSPIHLLRLAPTHAPVAASPALLKLKGTLLFNLLLSPLSTRLVVSKTVIFAASSSSTYSTLPSGCIKYSTL